MISGILHSLLQSRILAEKGFFESTLLDTYGAMGTKLGGHPDMHKLPGIESNTGALGMDSQLPGGWPWG